MATSNSLSFLPLKKENIHPDESIPKILQSKRVKNCPERSMNISITELTPSTSQEFKCSHCTQTFEYKSSLIVHEMSHKQKITCQVCSKKVFKENMEEHMKVHLKNKSYECDYCGLKTPTKFFMLLHQRHHTNTKKFQCKTCKKGFNDKRHYNNHLLMHLDSQPFKCDLCPKSYARKQLIEFHMIGNHQSERKLKCTVCFYTTVSLGELRKHRLTHLGSCKCEVCGKEFKERRFMKLHHQAVHVASLDYQCNFCQKLFVTETYVRRHLRLIHKSDSSNYTNIKSGSGSEVKEKVVRLRKAKLESKNEAFTQNPSEKSSRGLIKSKADLKNSTKDLEKSTRDLRTSKRNSSIGKLSKNQDLETEKVEIDKITSEASNLVGKFNTRKRKLTENDQLLEEIQATNDETHSNDHKTLKIDDEALKIDDKTLKIDNLSQNRRSTRNSYGKNQIKATETQNSPLSRSKPSKLQDKSLKSEIESSKSENKPPEIQSKSSKSENESLKLQIKSSKSQSKLSKPGNKSLNSENKSSQLESKSSKFTETDINDQRLQSGDSLQSSSIEIAKIQTTRLNLPLFSSKTPKIQSLLSKLQSPRVESLNNQTLSSGSKCSSADSPLNSSKLQFSGVKSLNAQCLSSGSKTSSVVSSNFQNGSSKIQEVYEKNSNNKTLLSRPQHSIEKTTKIQILTSKSQGSSKNTTNIQTISLKSQNLSGKAPNLQILTSKSLNSNVESAKLQNKSIETQSTFRITKIKQEIEDFADNSDETLQDSQTSNQLSYLNPTSTEEFPLIKEEPSEEILEIPEISIKNEQIDPLTKIKSETTTFDLPIRPKFPFSSFRPTIRSKLSKFIPPQRFSCPTCRISFDHQSQLLVHQLNHKKEVKTKFQCDLCGKSFREKFLIEIHMNVLHTNVKIYKCTMCDHTTTKYQAFRNHKMQHFDLIKCLSCPQQFKTERAMMEHHRALHVMTRRFFCEICEKTFMSGVYFKKHVTKMHSITKLKCSYCEKVFQTRNELTKHIGDLWKIKKCSSLVKAEVESDLDSN